MWNVEYTGALSHSPERTRPRTAPLASTDAQASAMASSSPSAATVNHVQSRSNSPTSRRRKGLKLRQTSGLNTPIPTINLCKAQSQKWRAWEIRFFWHFVELRVRSLFVGRVMNSRPPFIVSTSELPERSHVYPQSDEEMGPVRSAGSAAGLVRLGINLQRLPPGRRSSWPHAESDEEEFVYVIEGEVDAWIDGELHRMHAGDLAAFPAGTGISHCFINNTEAEALLLVGGEATKPSNRIVYPLNPSRRADLKAADWWHDVPPRTLGDHDGLPDQQRGSKRSDSAV